MKNHISNLFLRLPFWPVLAILVLLSGSGCDPSGDPSSGTDTATGISAFDDIEVVYNAGINDVALAWIAPNGQRQIILNPAVYNRLPPQIQAFIMAHERGHHALGHTDRIHHVNATPNAQWLRQGLELEADCWAARMVPPETAQFAAQFFVATQGPFQNSPYHPPGTARAQRIMQCSGLNLVGP